MKIIRPQVKIVKKLLDEDKFTNHPNSFYRLVYNFGKENEIEIFYYWFNRATGMRTIAGEIEFNFLEKVYLFFSFRNFWRRVIEKEKLEDQQRWAVWLKENDYEE